MKDTNKIRLNSFPVEEELKRRKEFSEREVGFTHPDLNSFIRLNDQGDIEIFAAPGIGIVISGRSKSVSIFGDSIRLMCKEDGLRWNTYRFNYAASAFMEPTLVKVNYKDIHSAQNGASYYLNTINLMDLEDREKPVTIVAENSFSTSTTIPEQKIVSESDISDLTFEQIGLIEAYSSTYSKEHIDKIIKYIRTGLSFDDANKIAIKELNE